MRRLAIAGLAVLAACRNTAGPPPAIDPAMASCVPSSTTVVAGVDLARLRASPLYAKLPPGVVALLDPLRDAHTLLLAFDGQSLVTVARGPFRETPAGATAVAKDLIVAGASSCAAKPAPSNLLSYAATIAPAAPIWIAARGGVILPLTGNGANLNRLLRDCENAGLTLKLGPPAELAFTAIGRTPDAATKVENTLRATITLTAAGESRHPDVVALLHAIQLSTSDRTVRATLTASPDAVDKLIDGLTR